ncbi:type IV toxin-antitoxin system AbiEi family antitoxin [candidate division WOR-3 bacterium]|nr:type IV toxin-antitoxin system AbiEi family antitoxin [candidate division WOR-3 bacterium]
MNRQNPRKLNQLLKIWPKNTVAISKWLKEQGIYRQLIEIYEKSAWIESIGHGAYMRSGDKIDWTSGLYALQEQLKLNVHVGARSALELHGYGHFIPFNEKHPIYIFGLSRYLPKWFMEYNRGSSLKYTFTNCFPYEKKIGLSKIEMGEYSITISSNEMAIMEVLFLVDKTETFEHAGLLMEGLKTLRPDLVQWLLEKTVSVKVKRLFMYFAEKFNQPWVSHLNTARIDFGKGKRVISKGGVLDVKYLISVPNGNQSEK